MKYQPIHPKRTRRWLWKIPLAIVLLLIICLAGVILYIESIAKDRINHALADYLVEGGRLNAIDVGLLAGRIELGGLEIQPPKGHGTEPLLAVGNLILDVEPASLFGDVIVIEELTLRNLVVNLVRDKNGRAGLDRLLKADTSPGPPSDERTDAPDQPDKKGPPVILAKRIRVEGGTITYQDSALTGKPMVFPLTDIQLAVDRLRLFDENKGADPASISLSLQLQQPGKLPAAHFGLLATAGPVGRGVPSTNAQARMTGFKLDTLGSLIPPATRTAIGGDGVDSGVALALDKERIRLGAAALTDHNVRFDTIRVDGPLKAPVVDIAPVLSSVFRVTGGVLNFGKSGLGAGIRIAESSVDVAKEVGSGTLKVGKKFLGGLLDTGKGLATLDAKQMQEGLAGSTVGTIELSLDSAKGAGSTAGSGVGRSVSTLTGEAAVDAWEKGIPTRHAAAMDQARQALAKMPYPPLTD